MSEDKNKNGKNIKERVEDITTRTFWITNCPEEVWKEFNEYAIKETNNNYSTAIKLLLRVAKTDAKSSVLYERFIELDKRMSTLEHNFNELIKNLQSSEEEVELNIEDDEELADNERVEEKIKVTTMGGSGNFEMRDREN